MMACPVCRSVSVAYKAKAKEWECLDCEERFPGPPLGGPVGQPEPRSGKAALPKAIFFSYGHDQSRELVDRFKGDLEKRGHTIWVDYKEIGAWNDWRGKITEGIHGSHLAMAFLSKHATRDPGVCRNEIAMALNRFGTVYPILLEPEQEVTPPVTITHLQWQDLSLWRQICDGLVQGKEWERWYEERLLEIISLVEGEASQFEGEISAMRAVLQPATFSSDIARHVPGFVGREWVFDAYHEWLDHHPESRLFWIKAGPGVGKTAIAAMLAHEHQQAIVGAWFCQTGSIERSNPHKALHTLAFQLAARWPDYRIKLRFQLGFNASTSPKDWDGLRESLLKKNLPDLFHHLFAEPLTGLIYRDRRLVIVIDALDEATDGEGKNELTDLIAGQFSKLPSWLGFIVTSRPDPSVMSRLQGFKPFELDAHGEHNRADLGQYLDIELGKQDDFARLPEAEQDRLKSILLEKSEGMVLYLQQIVEGLKAGALTLAAVEETPRGLGGLYHNDFAYRFSANEEYERDIKPLLRLVLAAPGPLPKSLALAVLEGDKESWFRKRSRLGAYLIDTPDGLQLFHKTLREWLLDEASGAYFIDPLPAAKELGRYLWEKFEKRDPESTLEWQEQILNWLTQLMPLLPQWEDADQLNEFGLFLGKHYALAQAEIILRRALTIQEKLLGPEHPYLARSIDQLAFVLRKLGRYKEGEILHRRGLVIREKLPVQNDLEIAVSCNNVANVLCEIGLPNDEARMLCYRALLIRENLLGVEHPDVAESLLRFAILCAKSWEEKETLCRRALAILERRLGIDHPDTLRSLKVLSSMIYNQGRYIESEMLYREVLAKQENMLGPDHPVVAYSLISLGHSLAEQRRYGEADPLYSRALAIFEKFFGHEHPDTAGCCFRMANSFKNQDRQQEAEPLYRRALAIQEKMLGPKHPSTTGTRAGLALLQYTETFLRHDLALQVKMFGTEDQKVANSCDSLASMLSSRGQYAEAEELYLRALEIREKVFGTDHRYVAKSLHDLSYFFIGRDRYKEAEALCRRELAIREKVIDPEKIEEMETANSCSQLIRVLKKLGQIEEAEKLRRHDLLIWEKKLGSEDPRVAESLDDLAYLTEMQGKKEEAEMLWHRALAIRVKALGTEHRDTVKNRNKLADFLYAQGRHEEAEAFASEWWRFRKKYPFPSNLMTSD